MGNPITNILGATGLLDLDKPCQGSGNAAETSKLPPKVLADRVIEKLENNANNTKDFSSPVRTQCQDTAQYLKDLKANDPAKFEKFANSLAANSLAGYNDLMSKNVVNGLVIPKAEGGSSPQNIKPDALKSVIDEIIAGPAEDAHDIMMDHHNKFWETTPIAQAATANRTRSPAATEPANKPAPSIPQQTLSPSAPAQPLVTSNKPGMLLTALNQTNGPDKVAQTVQSGGSFDFKSLFQGNMLTKLFSDIMQKLSEMFNGTHLNVLGNNNDLQLTRDMAALSGTNPTVTALSPTGQSTELGQASTIGTPQLQPSSPSYQQNMALNTIKTPQMNMGMA